MTGTGEGRAPDDQWFDCLPSCEAQVPCGQGRHLVRWEAGSLRLPEHPDIEGELVLAALGGDKSGCVELAEMWGRHIDDLSVLAIGPRGPADEIMVGWDDVAAAAQATGSGSVLSYGGLARPGLMRLASLPPNVPAAVAARRRQVQQEVERALIRRNDMLSLLALGYGFQVRLAGHVAQAQAGRLDDSRVRPALVAAITGRLAPVAEQWLGIDPDQVVVSLHHGPGWGSVELTGHGQQRRLRVSVPPGWLARVWACGLALTGRHLVVAVERAGWPGAQVLGLPAPGAEPVPLEVHGTVGSGGRGDAPHWET